MNGPKVLIVSGCSHCTTSQYRCVHLKEQLNLLGKSVAIQECFDPEALDSTAVLAYDLLFLYRLPMTHSLEQVIMNFRESKKLVIFDADDLVFEPTLTKWHRALDVLSEEEKIFYHRGVRGHLATLEASDYVVVATPLLAELARRRNKNAFVLRNALGQEMKAHADRLYRNKKDRSNASKVIVGYGSGTPTHDRDFQEAVPALMDMLARHSQVELWVVGTITLPKELEIFKGRISRFPLSDWQGWFEVASQFDINLAPLERGNIFCRAKSEIKFIEAAALGVPTVATRIDPFEFSIRPGENGLLAGDTGEWIEALEKLITYPSWRKTLGEAARQTVEEGYTVEIRARELSKILDTIFPHGKAAFPRKDLNASEDSSVPLVVNWMLSEPLKGSGGYTNIFRMIKLLVEFGHECHIYICPWQVMVHFSDSQMKEFVDRYFFPTGAFFHRWNGEVQDADASFATTWDSAYRLLDLPNTGCKYYFVQDFEPYFFPVGSQYIQAENTYRFGYHCITLGKWLSRLMKEHYKGQADYFDFALDHKIFFPRGESNQTHPRIAFYTRPSTPRRAYPLGVEALQIVKNRCPEAEIVFYGAEDLEFLPSFSFTNMGILPEQKLAELYSSCHIGLVFSLTNPSLVDLEMMACRCAVVDIKSERVEGLLSHEDNALLADPNPEAIAAAILRLLNDDELYRRIVSQAFQQVQNLSWKQSAKQVESVLLTHAPPPAEREMSRRKRKSGNILGQIHQLLEQTHHERESRDRLEKKLSEAFLREAERLSYYDHLKEEVYHLISRRFLRRFRFFLLQATQKFTGRRQAWLGPYRMVKIDPKDHTLSQTFQAERPYLYQIELIFAKHYKAGTRSVLFDLWEGEKKERHLFHKEIAPFEISRDKPYAIYLEPQSGSAGCLYTFDLRVPGSLAGDGHAWWTLKKPIYPSAQLVLDNHRRKGQIAFQAIYRENQGQVAGPPGAGIWGSPIEYLPQKIKRFTARQRSKIKQLASRVFLKIKDQGLVAFIREIPSHIRRRLSG
jgi:O-antigen biosynthesis protein